MSNGEPWAVGTVTRPKARVEHKCCECRKTILKGEVYERAKGLWDGSWLLFKTCASCLALRAELLKTSEEGLFHYGGLAEELDYQRGEKL